MTIDGHLLNDLWALDLDSMTWSHCTCYGLAPAARKGAQMLCGFVAAPFAAAT
jgi:hypothetical protein